MLPYWMKPVHCVPGRTVYVTLCGVYHNIFHFKTGRRMQMVLNCVAVGCTNQRSKKPGLTVHLFLSTKKEAEALVVSSSTSRYRTVRRACMCVSFCFPSSKAFPWECYLTAKRLYLNVWWISSNTQELFWHCLASYFSKNTCLISLWRANM